MQIRSKLKAISSSMAIRELKVIVPVVAIVATALVWQKHKDAVQREQQIHEVFESNLARFLQANPQLKRRDIMSPYGGLSCEIWAYSENNIWYGIGAPPCDPKMKVVKVPFEDPDDPIAKLLKQ